MTRTADTDRLLNLISNLWIVVQNHNTGAAITALGGYLQEAMNILDNDLPCTLQRAMSLYSATLRNVRLYANDAVRAAMLDMDLPARQNRNFPAVG